MIAASCSRAIAGLGLGFQGVAINCIRRRHTSLFFVRRSLQTGIVGLPNVGKSTLFNALVGSQLAEAANYPFCTIEPNTGLVTVPDTRLEILKQIHKSVKVVPTVVEFVDIAGIVKGASEGAGLGNKFLANIRSTDAIVQVVRCFENEDIIHVDTTVDPLRDIEAINLELILADIAQIEKRVERCKRDKKGNQIELAALEKVMKDLSDGVPARKTIFTDAELLLVKPLSLLTLKPIIYAANVSDADYATGNKLSDKVKEFTRKDGSKMVVVSAQVESELMALPKEDQMEFLAALGVKSDQESGLKLLSTQAYDALGLQTFFTSGPTETRAWTIRKGATAPEAAGCIHSDMEKGFIRAEIMDYDQLVEHGSEKAMRDKGLLRSEGKDYIMKEGDVVLFRFNNT